jgi:hypothetical protein
MEGNIQVLYTTNTINEVSFPSPISPLLLANLCLNERDKKGGVFGKASKVVSQRKTTILPRKLKCPLTRNK